MALDEPGADAGRGIELVGSLVSIWRVPGRLVNFFVELTVKRVGSGPTAAAVVARGATWAGRFCCLGLEGGA